jgi:ankyrin repeat protein
MLLLQYHANPNLQCPYGWTALHKAASARDLTIAKILLDNNSNVELQTSLGATAKDLAFQLNDEAMFNLIAQYEDPIKEPG